MENILISSTRDTQFDFTLTASGLDIKRGSVYFCIKQSAQTSILIHCRHLTGQQWTVKFPKNALSVGNHAYKLCVVVDDFYFEPVSGKIDVVSKDTVHVGPVSDKPTQTKSSQDEKGAVSEETQPTPPDTITHSETTEKTILKSHTDTPEEKPKPILELDADVLHTHSKRKPIKEESAEYGDYTPSFDFFVTDHPYQQLPDKGEKDRRVREILNSFKSK